jgi:hypothetical protein
MFPCADAALSWFSPLTSWRRGRAGGGGTAGAAFVSAPPACSRGRQPCRSAHAHIRTLPSCAALRPAQSAPPVPAAATWALWGQARWGGERRILGVGDGARRRAGPAGIACLSMDGMDSWYDPTKFDIKVSRGETCRKRHG